jgi:hypothetical protein
MKKTTWNNLTKARTHYRAAAEEINRSLPKLRALQQKFVDDKAAGKIAGSSGPAYKIETPVLYNYALDDLTQNDEIKLILVADNPGRREQAAENRRYLVGPSGKIAEKFFRENPELGIDFRKNVVILNKTPVHTPRTGDLKELCRRSGPALAEALAESQRTMAALLLEFHRALAVPVWITGYSEMKKAGIFEAYTEALKDLYKPPKAGTGGRSATGLAPFREQLFFFRHFSMNQFTIDLHKQAAAGETLGKSLERIGRAYRLRILGW